MCVCADCNLLWDSRNQIRFPRRGDHVRDGSSLRGVERLGLNPRGLSCARYLRISLHFQQYRVYDCVHDCVGLSYSIQLTSLLKMAVRVSATLEAQFNSVERVRHYIENTTAEDEHLLAPPSTSSRRHPDPATTTNKDLEMQALPTSSAEPKKQYITPPADWPSAGRLEFRQASMRYRDGPLVLKQVSFTVDKHMKIGTLYQSSG